MHAFVHPASRRSYGAALTEAEKAQYRRDVQSGVVDDTSPVLASMLAATYRVTRGIPVEGVSSAENTQRGAASTSSTTSTTSPVSAPASDTTTETESRAFPWAWVIGGTVLLGGAGLAAWYFTRPKAE